MELHQENEQATPRVRLGNRIRVLRKQAGLSQRGLCQKLGNMPQSYLGRVERGEQLPSKSLVDMILEFFNGDEVVRRLWEMVCDNSIADYTRTFVDREKEALRIQVFTNGVIPGLLQTEDYTRALFRASRPFDSEGETTWRKSTYSNGDYGECVEVAGGYCAGIPVRDSKNPHGPALVFTNNGWQEFITSIKGGEF